MTNPDAHIRDMIADRLSEYQSHRANAATLLRGADDADDQTCECDEECECSEAWERSEYISAAQVEATLANAAATTMAALVGFMEKAS